MDPEALKEPVPRTRSSAASQLHAHAFEESFNRQAVSLRDLHQLPNVNAPLALLALPDPSVTDADSLCSGSLRKASLLAGFPQVLQEPCIGLRVGRLHKV